MARIIVTADRDIKGAPPVLLDESVYSVHLSTGHAAMQLIERLGWALSDAEAIEQAQTRRGTHRISRNRGSRNNLDRDTRSRQPVRA